MLLLDGLERQVLADRQVAAVWMAAGMDDIELPTLQERRLAFDESLIAEPEAPAEMTEQMELRQALGVA